MIFLIWLYSWTTSTKTWTFSRKKCLLRVGRTPCQAGQAVGVPALQKPWSQNLLRASEVTSTLIQILQASVGMRGPPVNHNTVSLMYIDDTAESLGVECRVVTAMWKVLYNISWVSTAIVYQHFWTGLLHRGCFMQLHVHWATRPLVF